MTSWPVRDRDFASVGDLGQCLKGRVAIITGAASGISRAMAEALGRAGARLILLDVNGEGAQAAVTALESNGVPASARRLDVTDAGSVEETMTQIAGEQGRIDILFNGAGLVRRGPVLAMTEQDWDAVLAVNLRGTFLCARAAAHHMVQQRFGRIVNIASGQAQGAAHNAQYAASKAGVIAFTRSFAIELRATGADITVNCVAPGATDTPLWRTGKTPQEIERLLSTGAIHQPGDMAAVVVFLATSSSWALSGQLLERG